MDRQCKQRRLAKPENGAFPDPVEAEHQRTSSPLRSADHYLGVSPKAELNAAPSYDFFNSGSVTAPEHVMPGRSVFDTEFHDPGTASSIMPCFCFIETPCFCFIETLKIGSDHCFFSS